MKRKDQLLLHLLPMTLAAALVAAPVLAQSPGAAGGASGNTGATGTDSRPSTTQGSTGTTGTGSTSGSSTAQGTTGTTGTTGSTTSGTTATTPGTSYGTSAGTATGAWPAGSVVMHRPRLSQLIGTNVYNDRNETIGEVDDIILATPAGMGPGTTGPAPRTGTSPSGTTTGSTTTGTTTPGGTSAGTGSTGTSNTGTTTPGSTMPGSTMPGASTSAGAMQGPMAIIQVGGFLGMGGRLVAVPLSELQWNAERERIIMPNASKETLQGRPAFSYDTLRRG